MTRIHDQHRRLYGPPDASQTGAEAHGLVRALVIGLRAPADWAVLGAVWRGVQADLDLPAPGIVVNGVDGLELWFSLAEPRPVAEAAAWVDALVKRYLPDVKPARLRLWPRAKALSAIPESAAAAVLPRPAPYQAGPDRWSAFVAPDLAAVFADDPALDMPPGDEAQADLLSRLASITPAGFVSALEVLSPTAGPALTPEPAVPHMPVVQATLAGPFQDPRQFLLAVLNDASVPLPLRIQAAQALLPGSGGTV